MEKREKLGKQNIKQPTTAALRVNLQGIDIVLDEHEQALRQVIREAASQVHAKPTGDQWHER